MNTWRKTTRRKTANARARRRARCHKPKDKREKATALAPVPSLPDPHVQSAEDAMAAPRLVVASRQLPAIEPEPVVLELSCGPRTALPNRSTLRRILDERGDWAYRLGVRLAWPGKHPGLPWLPQVIRRDEQRAPLPELIDIAEVRSEAIRVGFARAVREARDERYLDAGQLAEDAEMPRWQLTALEEGRLTPLSYTLILRIARALGMKPSDLVQRGEDLEVEL
jgi:DNA-binding Xre family transcriptional regulator